MSCSPRYLRHAVVKIYMPYQNGLVPHSALSKCWSSPRVRLMVFLACLVLTSLGLRILPLSILIKRLFSRALSLSLHCRQYDQTFKSGFGIIVHRLFVRNLQSLALRYNTSPQHPAKGPIATLVCPTNSFPSRFLLVGAR